MFKSFLFSDKPWLTLLMLSTPIAIMLKTFQLLDKEWAAIANSYAFSVSFWFLYFLPFIREDSFKKGLEGATTNWILYLTCGTEIFIQIPHTLFASYLYLIKDSDLEWAFYAYSLSDSRWRDYRSTNGNLGVLEFGLPVEVDLINWNDGLLGLAVLVSYYFYTILDKTKPKTKTKTKTKINTKIQDDENAANVQTKAVASRSRSRMITCIFVLITVFRDATLWRETVEYLYMHHRSNYEFTTGDPRWRHHAIYLLWLINGIWLIAPIFTVRWAYDLLNEDVDDTDDVIIVAKKNK